MTSEDLRDLGFGGGAGEAEVDAEFVEKGKLMQELQINLESNNNTNNTNNNNKTE